MVLEQLNNSKNLKSIDCESVGGWRKQFPTIVNGDVKLEYRRTSTFCTCVLVFLVDAIRQMRRWGRTISYSSTLNKEIPKGKTS